MPLAVAFALGVDAEIYRFSSGERVLEIC